MTSLDFLNTPGNATVELSTAYDGSPSIRWTEEYKSPQLTLSILRQVAQYFQAEDVRVNYISDSHDSLSGNPSYYGYEFLRGK